MSLLSSELCSYEICSLVSEKIPPIPVDFDLRGRSKYYTYSVADGDQRARYLRSFFQHSQLLGPSCSPTHHYAGCYHDFTLYLGPPVVGVAILAITECGDLPHFPYSYPRRIFVAILAIMELGDLLSLCIFKIPIFGNLNAFSLTRLTDLKPILL